MSNNSYSSESQCESPCVQAADQVFVWSIKYQKLISLSKDDFEKKMECQICIPIYRFREKERKTCTMNFSSLNQLKSHIRRCENVWRRELMWTTKTEIPSNLQREREIGDLSSLQDETTLKIKFATKTLIFHKDSILSYFKRNYCACKDEFGIKCQVITMGASLFHFFSHLSHVERSQNKYVLFKATADELYDEDNKFAPVIVKANENFTVKQISADELESLMRKKGKSFRKSLFNDSSTSLPSPINLTKNKKRSKSFKAQSKDRPDEKTRRLTSVGIKKKGRPFKLSRNRLNVSAPSKQLSIVSNDQSSDLFANLLQTVYFYDGKEQPYPRQISNTNQTHSNIKRTLVIDGEQIEVLYCNESDSDLEDDQTECSTKIGSISRASTGKQIEYEFDDGIKIVEMSREIDEQMIDSRTNSTEINVTDVLDENMDESRINSNIV